MTYPVATTTFFLFTLWRRRPLLFGILSSKADVGKIVARHEAGIHSAFQVALGYAFAIYVFVAVFFQAIQELNFQRFALAVVVQRERSFGWRSDLHRKQLNAERVRQTNVSDLLFRRRKVHHSRDDMTTRNP